MPPFLSIPRWIAFFWPRACLLCGKACHGVDDAALCAACLPDLPRLAPPCCPVCASPLATPAPACGACLANAPAYDATLATWRYGEPLAGLIREFKFGGRGHRRFANADFFVSAMLAGERPTGDVVVPVPLSPARLRERGFNQSVEIARPLARALDLPLDGSSLLRRRDTPPQSRLPWRARRRNVADAFECQGDFTGRRVIVVDDVMTTGATLDAVARILKDHGATHVSNWVVARAVKLAG